VQKSPFGYFGTALDEIERGTNTMIKHDRIRTAAQRMLAGTVLLLAAQPAILAAQLSKQPKEAPPMAGPMSEQELQATQEQLLQLLRTSPTLTTVVAHDPSLLSDQEYVIRNNPQLAQFLVQHPDIARNPEYFLFTNLNVPGGRRTQALERAVWPEFGGGPPAGPSRAREVVEPFAALLAWACFLGTSLWLVRMFLENRRWSRSFKLQSDVHARLIERFSSSQELASYMESEAGRRFLEAAPISVGFEQNQRMPNAVARVLTPLQIGFVLVLLGIGFFLLRNVNPEMNTPMLVLSVVTTMPGIGFILSAGVTWILAGRLGLIPDNGPDSDPLVPAKQDRH
jgi:hypothetical protein